MISVKNNKIFIISGRIASGKTTLINLLCKKYQNSYAIFADEIVNELYKKNNIGYEFIKKYIGKNYVNDLCVNKTKLFKLFFLNPAKLLELEEFLYPHIIKIIKNKIHNVNNKIIFVEIPPKSFIKKILNSKIIVLCVSYEEQVKRLKKENRNISFVLNEYISFFNNQNVDNFYKYAYNIKTDNIAVSKIVNKVVKYVSKSK